MEIKIIVDSLGGNIISKMYPLYYDLDKEKPTSIIVVYYSLYEIITDNFTLLFNDKPINPFYKLIELLENTSQLILYFSIIINQNQNKDIGCDKIKHLLALKTDGTILKLTYSNYVSKIDKLKEKTEPEELLHLVNKKNKKIITIISDKNISAALIEPDDLFLWGNDISDNGMKLSNVKKIVKTTYGFFILTNEGKIIYLHDDDDLIESPELFHPTKYLELYVSKSKIIVMETLPYNNIKDIYSGLMIISLVDYDNLIYTILDSKNRKLEIVKFDNIKQIYNTYVSFAALLNDNTVITWGNSNFGGNSNSVKDDLVDIVKIFPMAYHFIALKSNGTAILWGDIGNTKGNYNLIKEYLNDIIDISTTDYSFSALKNNGTVFYWHIDYFAYEINFCNFKYIPFIQTLKDCKKITEYDKFTKIISCHEFHFSSYNIYAGITINNYLMIWTKHANYKIDGIENVINIASNCLGLMILSNDGLINIIFYKYLKIFGVINNEYHINSCKPYTYKINLDEYDKIISTHSSFLLYKTNGNIIIFQIIINDNYTLQQDLYKIESIEVPDIIKIYDV